MTYFAYLNFPQTAYLGASLFAGYQSIKQSLSASCDSLKIPFGSDSLSDRLQRVVQEVSEGHFKIKHFFFGTETKQKKIIQLTTIALRLSGACLLALMSYYFFQKSKEIPFTANTQDDLCFSQMNEFSQKLSLAFEQKELWEQNVCNYEKSLWDAARSTQQCYNAPSLFSWQIDDFCEQEWTRWTFKYLNEVSQVKTRLYQKIKKLNQMKDEGEATCQKYLNAYENEINLQCQKFYPYLHLEPQLFCSLTHLLPHSFSKACKSTCNLYQKEFSIIKSTYEQPLPKYQSSWIGCEKKRAYPKPFSAKILMENQPTSSPSEVLIKHLSKHPKAYLKSSLNQTHFSSEIVRNKQQKANPDLCWIFQCTQEPLKKEERAFFITRQKVIRDLEFKSQYQNFINQLNLNVTQPIYKKMTQPKQVFINNL